MPLFIIHALDKPDSLDLRMATRAQHLEYVKANAANVCVGGPLLADDGETFVGTMFVLQGDSAAAVRAWAANDPYTLAGLFAAVHVHPYKWLLGDGKPE